MSTSSWQPGTPEEYLSWERQSSTKHGFWQGTVFAMSGASKEHVRIAGNLYRHLANQLDGQPCEPFGSDLRVKVPATGLYTYPDLSIACPPLEFEDAHGDTLLNPKVLIEVLSPSTERYDRRVKFHHYQQSRSVQEIVFVTQDAPYVERFIRQEDGTWQFDNVTGLEGTLHIDSIACQVTLAQVYQGVEFPPETLAQP